MKSITIESEHFTLLAGLLFMLMGILWFTFFIIGVSAVVCSYAIDLTKRVKECDYDCQNLPESLRKQTD